MDRPKEIQTESHKPSIADDLLVLYDEVTEFHDCCAFLCDAFCSLAAEERALDTSTIEGLKCFSYWIRQRVVDVKKQLKEIQERAFTGMENSGSTGART